MKDKLFECKICGQLLKGKRSNLQRHEKLHNGIQKKVKCEHCESSFQSTSNYKKHLAGVHKIQIPRIFEPKDLIYTFTPGKSRMQRILSCLF